LWAVIGLGNPGKTYTGTRHNMGFAFVKDVAKSMNAKLKKRRDLSKTVLVDMDDNRVLLVLPQTYMNLSGSAVMRILDQREISPSHMVVVYDDMDISLGEIRIRKEGRAGSHRGMKSVVQAVGTTKFPRIRMGIGPLPPGRDASDFVLSHFLRREQPLVRRSIQKARDALEMVLSGDIEGAMNTYNQRNRIEKESIELS